MDKKNKKSFQKVKALHSKKVTSFRKNKQIDKEGGYKNEQK